MWRGAKAPAPKKSLLWTLFEEFHYIIPDIMECLIPKNEAPNDKTFGSGARTNLDVVLQFDTFAI